MRLAPGLCLGLKMSPGPGLSGLGLHCRKTRPRGRGLGSGLGLRRRKTRPSGMGLGLCSGLGLIVKGLGLLSMHCLGLGLKFLRRTMQPFGKGLGLGLVMGRGLELLIRGTTIVQHLGLDLRSGIGFATSISAGLGLSRSLPSRRQIRLPTRVRYLFDVIPANHVACLCEFVAQQTIWGTLTPARLVSKFHEPDVKLKVPLRRCGKRINCLAPAHSNGGKRNTCQNLSCQNKPLCQIFYGHAALYKRYDSAQCACTTCNVQYVRNAACMPANRCPS